MYGIYTQFNLRCILFMSSKSFNFTSVFLIFLALNAIAADVLLWRNKTISASFLTGATIVWVLFEWLNYNFISLLCFVLVLGLLAQFLWSNASGFLNRWFKQLDIFSFSHLALISVNMFLSYITLIDYDLWFMLTVHHLKYLVLLSQKSYLWTLQL